MSPESLNPVTYIGRTDFRNAFRVFGIKRNDRRSHHYVIGRTGTGKSTLLEMLIRQDMERGEGVALLDPHGDLVERVLERVPLQRKKDLIYFNVPDGSNPVGFNPLDCSSPDKRPLAALGILDAFKKLWLDSWGPRLEHILRNALLALLDHPGSNLAYILRLLDDRSFRKGIVATVLNPRVRDFWLREYEGYSERFRVEAIAPIQNKVGAFLSNPLLQNILTTPKNSLHLRQVIDEGKILLVNLAKGKIGEDSASLLGALLVSAMGWAALSRADIPESERRDFYLYLDEFQNFTTQSLADMLSELRKYRLSLTLSHQFLSQIDLKVRDAILGNVGTIISFRLGAEDAEIIEREFLPDFSAHDLVNLPNYRMYLKLMIDGVPSKPFSATSISPDDVEPDTTKD